MVEPGDVEGEHFELEIVEATHKGFQQSSSSLTILRDNARKV